MKYALLFFMLGLSPHGEPFTTHERILETFVELSACIAAADREFKRAADIANELEIEQLNTIRIGCIPYTGPWKKES